MKRHSVTGSAGRFAALASLAPVAPALAALVFLAATLPAAPRAIAAEGGDSGRQSFTYADTDPATAQVGSGRVRFLEGSLKIQRADAETVDEGTVNAPVFPGDTLTTASSARAEVQLSNGAIVRLDQNTKVAFIALPFSAEAGEDIVLQLPEGTAQLELRRAPPRDVDYRVDTPAASVYLLSSGSFRLDVEGRNGKVRVSSYRGIAEVVGDESSVMLRSGQRTLVSQSGEPDSPRAFNTAASDGFDGWVLDRNANYLQGRAAEASGNGDEAGIPDPIQPYQSELSTYGSWVTIEPYGNCWIPAGVSPGWRPYWNGYWSNTAYGQYWVSYDPWGWAPYHYGRWVWAPTFGWAWSPGWIFSGAWVSWYYGPAYVGWAPLDYWGWPCSMGYGYPWIDYRCWNFVGYHDVYVQHPRRVYVPTSVVRAEPAHRTGVILRKPVPISPRDISNNKVSPALVMKQARSAPAAAVIDPARGSGTKVPFREHEKEQLRLASGPGLRRAGAASSAPGAKGSGVMVRERKGQPGSGGTAATPGRPSGSPGASGAGSSAPRGGAKPGSQGGTEARPAPGASGDTSKPHGTATPARPRQMTRLEGRGSTIASEPDGMMKGRPRSARPAYDPDVLVIPADVGGPYDNRPDHLLREFFRDSDRRSGGRPPDQFQVLPPSGARQTPGSTPPSNTANSGGSSAKGRSGGSAPAAHSGGSGSKPPSGSSGSRPSQGGGSSGRASQGGGSKGGGGGGHSGGGGGRSGGGGKDK